MFASFFLLNLLMDILLIGRHYHKSFSPLTINHIELNYFIGHTVALRLAAKTEAKLNYSPHDLSFRIQTREL